MRLVVQPGARSGTQAWPVVLGLNGKRVLVTGGSRGIGRASVRAFARAGAQVVTCCRDADGAAKLDAELGAAELGGLGHHLVVAADVRVPAAVSELMARCAQHAGGLDVVVNNAGIDAHRPLPMLDDAEWDRVLTANLTSVMLVTQAALPLLAGPASVITIGASVASRGRPSGAHYAASKAALAGLTRSLAKELGPQGIRVNVVAPGVVADDESGPPPHLRAGLVAATALGRLATPGDIAAAVLFLASDLARFVSGTTLYVDGGV
jgi:3-oxoacyl-[acyl-carrier protein] reductase